MPHPMLGVLAIWPVAQLLKSLFAFHHRIAEMVIADIIQETGERKPPGQIESIGAILAHLAAGRTSCSTTAFARCRCSSRRPNGRRNVGRCPWVWHDARSSRWSDAPGRFRHPPDDRGGRSSAHVGAECAPPGGG